MFRGSEHVDELVHEGRHRPAATPPRALVAGVCYPARARHLGYVLRPRARAVGDTRAVDRCLRAPTRPTLRAASHASANVNEPLAFRAPERRGHARSPTRSSPSPEGFYSLPQPRKISPVNGGRLSAPLPRAPAARCPSFTRRSAWGSRVLSGEVTQRPTDAVSDRRLHDTLATSSGIAVLIVFERRDLQPIFLESIFDDFVIHHTAHSASFTSITLIWSYIPVRSFPAPRLFPIHRC